MTIKQQGGIFGRNPTFNNVTVDGTLTINGEPISDFGTMAQQDADAVAITGGTAALTSTTGTTLTTNQTDPTNAHAAVFEFSGGNVGSADPSAALVKLKTSSALRPVMSVQDKDNNYKMWVWPHGDIAFANGAGIDFSATSGTGTSELFDDYEKGTWTPTVVGSSTAGTATYGSQNGKYTKIGNQVFFEAYVNYSGGTGTGNLRISGLPFAHAGGATYGAVSIGEINAITLSALNVASAEVSSGSTSIFFYQNVVGGGTVTAIPYDAAGFITFGGHYTTS